MRKNKGIARLIIVIVIAVALVAILGGKYNRLMSLREDVNQSWAQVQNQVKRRADLIPNLTNTVKGYAKHEEETLTKITQARSGIESASTPKELAKADAELTRAINVVVESYPELKANENFLDLQSQLEGTENIIATERKRYRRKNTGYCAGIPFYGWKRRVFGRLCKKAGIPPVPAYAAHRDGKMDCRSDDRTAGAQPQGSALLFKIQSF